MASEHTDTAAPRRIQRQSTKGWRTPAGAILVAHPSKWGTPFTVGDTLTPDSQLWPYLLMTLPEPARSQHWSRLAINDRQTAVDAYAWWLYEQPDLMITAPRELRGHDLVCWCPLVDAEGTPVPCHADVLLALANAESET